MTECSTEVPRQPFHVIRLPLRRFNEPEELEFADGTHEPCSVRVASQGTQQ